MVVDGGLHGTSSSLMEISRSLRHSQELSLPEHRKDFLPIAVPAATGSSTAAAGCSNRNAGSVRDGMYVVMMSDILSNNVFVVPYSFKPSATLARTSGSRTQPPALRRQELTLTHPANSLRLLQLHNHHHFVVALQKLLPVRSNSLFSLSAILPSYSPFVLILHLPVCCLFNAPSSLYLHYYLVASF